MTTHARTGLGGLLVGSGAETVLRTPTSPPCCVMTRRPAWRIPRSRRQRDERDPPPIGFLSGIAASLQESDRDGAEESRDAASVKTTSTIVEGWPADRIVRAARASNADLIVMGTRGRAGFSRLVLGSVASRVISTSPCPVLTVRSK